MSRAPRVELLYFDGCPSYEAFLPELRRLLDAAGVDADVELVEIGDEATAVRERFLGSPTLRIDGRDVEPGASERDDVGLKCRLYPSAGGLAGRPSDGDVLAALARVDRAAGSSHPIRDPL